MSVKPDEKLDVCLKFVLRQYNVFVARTGGESESAAAGCFVVGITGCQGMSLGRHGLLTAAMANECLEDVARLRW